VSSAAVSVELDGLQETLRSFQGLEKDLRRTANGELRRAAGECASQLVGELQIGAASSGVPVAPRVARSAKVRSDRLPSVAIGGSARVGRRGAPASALVWGSEHGPSGSVNHFGVPPGSGYWIKPTVERFKSSTATKIFADSVATIQRRWGLT
jgi:hypothetical protein